MTPATGAAGETEVDLHEMSKTEPAAAIKTPPTDKASVSWGRRLLRLAIFSVLFMFVFLGLATWLVYSSAQKEPEFYQTALSLSEEEKAAQGSVFEKQVLDLQNDARTKQEWQAVFTETQINGWLAGDFLKTFPRALPPNVQDPRVGIDQDLLRVAFRFNSRRLKGIVQAEVDAFCTDVPGQIAVRIKKVSSGIVPIPVKSVADRISVALRSLGATVEWTQIDRDPVALIGLPTEDIKIGNKLIMIESIQLLENKLVLAGKSLDVK